jgi:DNA-binding CsgD family transcriptional regulator
MRLCEDMLRRGKTGAGGLVLIEGQPGMGKSLLLSEVAKAAAAAGYTTVAAVADQFARAIPLGPLLLALGDLALGDLALRGIPVGGIPEPSDPEPGDLDPRMREIARVRRSLERLAAHRPVLVTADDLQYADPVTLLAFRVLPGRLATHPLSWILARSTDSGTDAAQLFDMLERDGADRVTLGPLPEDVIVDLITQQLGATPDRALLSLASAAGGNPLLVRELLQGLRDEDMLRISAGRAMVAAERVPERVKKYFRQQTGSFPPRTRQLIEVSAVIGRSFAVEDVAEMLGEPPAVLLPAINEALAAGILVADGETLTFRDDMTWQAVTEAIPQPLTRALHRQFGQVLLDRGNELRAARHLVRGVRQDDKPVLLEMDRVVRIVLPNAPQTAADLAARALELTLPEDPAHAGRLVTAVRALAAAQRFQEAAKLIDMSLGAPLPALARAQLRSTRASIHVASGQPADARAEAEDLLAERDLPASVRDDATVALLAALAELPDFAAAQQRARQIISRADRSSSTVVAAARALQANVKWNQGQLTDSLGLFRQALAEAPAATETGTETGPGAGPETIHSPVRPLIDLELAARLADVGRFDEASALIAAPRAEGGTAGFALTQAGPALLRARIHLALGRLDAAAAEAETVLYAGRLGDTSPFAILARCMLSSIALRRGDLVSAGQLLDAVSARLADAGAGRIGIRCQLLAAQVAEARDGPAAAMGIVDGVYDYIRVFGWPLVQDPTVASWLVRLALEVGDGARASIVGGVAERLGRVNRAFPVVTAACAHAQGLLRSDIGLLRLAAETQPDVWASASAAEDLAVLLADADRVADAIRWLDRAYANFQESGGSRGAARVRGRLRRLGVQRRHWRSAGERPAQGVEGLTETERGITELVCQGLTNRQIAEQMFVSANTIAFHLRNIYRKLGVASRVQLARVVPDSAEPGTDSPAPEPPRP